MPVAEYRSNKRQIPWPSVTTPIYSRARSGACPISNLWLRKRKQETAPENAGANRRPSPSRVIPQNWFLNFFENHAWFSQTNARSIFYFLCFLCQFCVLRGFLKIGTCQDWLPKPASS